MAETKINLDTGRWRGRDEAFEFASRYLVAGMTTPGRRREELKNRQFVVSRGSGGYLYDLEGKKYVDLN